MARTEVFDVDFVRSYFRSPHDIERGVLSIPEPGRVFGISVAAPGCGKNFYRILAVRSDCSILTEVLRSTVRELTHADVE